MFNKIKSFKKGKKRINGRNNQGKITIRHRGGGLKRKCIYVDFFRNFSDYNFKVTKFLKNTLYNRSKIAYLTSCKNFSEKANILKAKNINIGDIVYNNFEKNFLLDKNFTFGSTYYMRTFYPGSKIHNIEIKPYTGGKISRSPGSYSIVINYNKSKDTTLIKLKSGKIKEISSYCRASFGQVDSSLIKKKINKAGDIRLLGIRPTVRGVAINPVDHPHGGGEGKSYVSRPPVSPWGSIIKGKKTKLLLPSNKY